MLLAIQLALLVVGIVVVIRGRMGGAKGCEVLGLRARLAGGLLAGMAGWSTATGMMVQQVPEGVERLSVIGIQAIWLLGAMVLASMVAGAGREEARAEARGSRMRRAA